MICTRVANCSLKDYVPSADWPCLVWTGFLNIWANILKCANFTFKKKKRPSLDCLFHLKNQNLWQHRVLISIWKQLIRAEVGSGHFHSPYASPTHTQMCVHVCARALFKDWRSEPGRFQDGYWTSTPIPYNHPAPTPTLLPYLPQHFHQEQKIWSQSKFNSNYHMSWAACVIFLLPRRWNVWIIPQTCSLDVSSTWSLPLGSHLISLDLFLFLRHCHWLFHTTLSPGTSSFILALVLTTTAA